MTNMIAKVNTIDENGKANEVFSFFITDKHVPIIIAHMLQKASEEGEAPNVEVAFTIGGDGSEGNDELQLSLDENW